MGASAAVAGGAATVGQAGRVTVGKVAVDHQHGQARSRPAAISWAMASKSKPRYTVGTTSSEAPALFGDEADLAAPVDGDQRVLAGAQPGQRAHQHQRLVPGGQLPADRRCRGRPRGRRGGRRRPGGRRPGNRRRSARCPVSSWARTASGVASARRSMRPHRVGAPIQPRAAVRSASSLDEVGHDAGFDHSRSV